MRGLNRKSGMSFRLRHSRRSDECCCVNGEDNESVPLLVPWPHIQALLSSKTVKRKSRPFYARLIPGMLRRRLLRFSLPRSLCIALQRPTERNPKPWTPYCKICFTQTLRRRDRSPFSALLDSVLIGTQNEDDSIKPASPCSAPSGKQEGWSQT